MYSYILIDDVYFGTWRLGRPARTIVVVFFFLFNFIDIEGSVAQANSLETFVVCLSGE